MEHGPNGNGNGNGDGPDREPPALLRLVLIPFFIVVYFFVFVMVTGTIRRMIDSGGQVGEVVSLLLIVAFPFLLWRHSRRTRS